MTDKITEAMVAAFRSKYREFFPGSWPDSETTRELLSASLALLPKEGEISEAAREYVHPRIHGDMRLSVEACRLIAVNAFREGAKWRSAIAREPVAIPALSPRPSYCEPRRFLLLASYCGGETDGCTDARPCADCLSMCNIYGEDGEFISDLGPSALALPLHVQEEQEEQEEQEDETLYAERLAISLWEKHWKEDAPDWKPLSGDLIGILTQIDNMTAGLSRLSPSPSIPEEKGGTAESVVGVSSVFEALKTPFCVLFLDGRNEHGSHVLTSYPRSFEVVDDDVAEQAEAILEAAENAGFQIGQHVWAEFDWVAPQYGDEGRKELDGYWDFRWINEKMTRAALLSSPTEGQTVKEGE